MNYYLSIDMGGTNLRFGLVDEKGQITWSDRIATRSGSSRDEMLKDIKQGIQKGLDFAKAKKLAVQGIGIGVPGSVDIREGFIYELVNVPGWENTPLASLLKENFNIPIFVDNDVNIMALGEYRFGAAQNARNVVCVTLGTGVGGGVIVEGELYRGSSFTAGELGHIVVEKNGPSCKCGNWGCLERYIGNRYLIERAYELYHQQPHLKIPEDLTPEDLTLRAEKQDEIAQRVWREAAEYLGIVLAGLVNFFNPDLIVIGGGVSKAGRFLFDPLEKVVHDRSMKVPARYVKIKAAQLEEPGLVGGAALVKASLKTCKVVS
jgi:glucokinase